MTQNKQILEYLNKGNSITPKVTLKFGVFVVSLAVSVKENFSISVDCVIIFFTYSFFIIILE